MIKITWSQIKQGIVSGVLTYAWIEDDNSYTITAFNGSYVVQSIIPITNPSSSDQSDFETNYKIPAKSSAPSSGSGCISALNGAVIANSTNASTLVFKITGTWVGSLNIQGSTDGGNTWDSIQGYVPSNGNWTNATTSNFMVTVPCGGYTNVQWMATAWTSGTANINYNASLGNNATQVFSTSAAAFQATARLNDGIGNGITSSSGGNSKQAIDVSSTSVDGYKATYSATSAIAFASATSATDIFTITGSATKTIRIIRIAFSAQETTAGVVNVLLIKRSAANTGGTSASAIAVPHDSTNSAATATVLNYTANPSSLGTSVGTVRAARVFIPTTGTDTADFSNEWDFGMGPEQAIVLRGISQVLALNLNSTTVIGGTWTCYIEWTEE